MLQILNDRILMLNENLLVSLEKLNLIHRILMAMNLLHHQNQQSDLVPKQRKTDQLRFTYNASQKGFARLSLWNQY